MSSTRSTSPAAPVTDAAPATDDAPATGAWASQALLLVGQGSERFAPPGQLLRAQAGRLGARNLFRQVEAACLAGEPSLRAALARITADTVHVVPFFMCDGFLVSTLLPKLLAQATADHPRRLHVHSAVGEHPGLADIAVRRAVAKAGALGVDPARLTLLLVGHGSPRNSASAAATRRHAARVAASLRFADVRVAFLDEAPEISGKLLQDLPAPAGVLSLFATVGLHGGEDVPNCIAAARAARGWSDRELLDLGIIGEEPDMAELVLGQIPVPAG